MGLYTTGTHPHLHHVQVQAVHQQLRHLHQEYRRNQWIRYNIYLIILFIAFIYQLYNIHTSIYEICTYIFIRYHVYQFVNLIINMIYLSRLSKQWNASALLKDPQCQNVWKSWKNLCVHHCHRPQARPQRGYYQSHPDHLHQRVVVMM